MERWSVRRRSVVTVPLILLTGSTARGEDTPAAKIALDIRPASVERECAQAYSSAAEITTTYSGTGELRVPGVLYGHRAIRSCEYGLSWPADGSVPFEGFPPCSAFTFLSPAKPPLGIYQAWDTSLVSDGASGT